MRKLSKQTQFGLAALGSPALVFGLGEVVLQTSHYGDKLPMLVKIGAPLALYAVTAWFLLAHPPKDLK